MAGALKQAFLEAVRLTPDGIAAFLETPLPEAPTVAAADNTANEALAAFLLDLFRAFAGLTPIELLLRIGQHNNVLESAMLAGLEYIEGADSEENLITIFEPIEGKTYTPGEMRFSCSVSNGMCTGVELVIGDGDPIKMESVDNLWKQYVNVTIADTTATMTATMEDGSTTSATVNFTVAESGQQPPPEEPPEPPGGSDPTAIQRAFDQFMAAIQKFLDALYAGDSEALPSAYQSIQSAFATIKQLASSAGPSVQTVIVAAESAFDAAYDLIVSTGSSAADTIAALIGQAAVAVQNIITQLLG